jgi:hypothetical protein
MAAKPNLESSTPTNRKVGAKVEPLIDAELEKKGVAFQGFNLQPGTYVQIPAKSERKTVLRAMRETDKPNIPCVVCYELDKKSDKKFVYTGNTVDVGISSLFNLDADNKPHENDLTCQRVAHLGNHKLRLDELENCVLAAGAEDVILVPLTDRVTGQDGVIRNVRLYNNDGSLKKRQKRFVPSSVVEGATCADN